MKSGYEVAYRWNLSKNGYNLEVRNSLWSRFWKIRVQERIKIVTWKLFYNGLLVADNLRKRGCETDITCVFCGFIEESLKHLFIDCWLVKSFWGLLREAQWPDGACSSLEDWIWHVPTFEY